MCVVQNYAELNSMQVGVFIKHISLCQVCVKLAVRYWEECPPG